MNYCLPMLTRLSPIFKAQFFWCKAMHGNRIGVLAYNKEATCNAVLFE